MTTTYTQPAFGTVKAFVVPWSPCTVQVQVFKFDSIRQDSYWVTKEVKTFKTVEKAQAYIARVMG